MCMKVYVCVCADVIAAAGKGRVDACVKVCGCMCVGVYVCV